MNGSLNVGSRGNSAYRDRALQEEPLTRKQLIAAFSGIAAFTYFLTATRVQRPAAPREYPYNGLEQELGGHTPARVETELDE